MKRIRTLLWSLSLLLSLAVPARGEDAFRQVTYEADGVTALLIDVRDRRIELLPSSDGILYVEGWEREGEACAFSREGDAVTLTLRTERRLRDFFGLKADVSKRTLSVRVPDAALESLDVRTTNERIRASSLCVTGEVSLYARGGDVEVDSLFAGRCATLEAKNGDVHGTLLGSAEEFLIDCRVKKGESSLPERTAGGDRRLTVRVNNGDVRLDFADAE